MMVQLGQVQMVLQERLRTSHHLGACRRTGQQMLVLRELQQG